MLKMSQYFDYENRDCKALSRSVYLYYVLCIF